MATQFTVRRFKIRKSADQAAFEKAIAAAVSAQKKAGSTRSGQLSGYRLLRGGSTGNAQSYLLELEGMMSLPAGIALDHRLGKRGHGRAGLVQQGWGSLGHEVQRRQPADVAARLPRRRTFRVEPEVGEELGEALDHDRELEPGEVRAQAEVAAVAERDVAVRVAVEDAALGVGEGARVVVRRRRRRAGRHRRPGSSRRGPRGRAPRCGRRPAPAR